VPVADKPLLEVLPKGGLDAGAFLEVALPLTEALAGRQERGESNPAFRPADLGIDGQGRPQLSGAMTSTPDPASTGESRFSVPLGLYFCALLTGETLFAKASARAVSQLMLREDADFLSRWRPNIPLELGRFVVGLALGHNGGSFREIHSALQTLQRQHLDQRLTYFPTPDEAARQRQSLLNWTLVLIALNLIIALVALFFWKR
jgi:hypothetical protein